MARFRIQYRNTHNELVDVERSGTGIALSSVGALLIVDDNNMAVFTRAPGEWVSAERIGEDSEDTPPETA